MIALYVRAMSGTPAIVVALMISPGPAEHGLPGAPKEMRAHSCSKGPAHLLMRGAAPPRCEEDRSLSTSIVDSAGALQLRELSFELSLRTFLRRQRPAQQGNYFGLPSHFEVLHILRGPHRGGAGARGALVHAPCTPHGDPFSLV